VVDCVWKGDGFRDTRDYYTDAIEAAKDYGKTEVITLLEDFKKNPEKTMHQVRMELDLFDEAAAGVFALLVFVSDGLLQINDTTPSPAARYFNIAAQLPLELQMVLCFRQVRSGKEIIQGRESEVAFKDLAKRIFLREKPRDPSSVVLVLVDSMCSCVCDLVSLS